MTSSIRLFIIVIVVLSFALGSFTARAQRSGPEVEYAAVQGGLPFSPYVRVDNMLYLSGQLGTMPGGGLAEGGVQAETQQTLENIRNVLERAGSSMNNVVKCSVFMEDMNQWPTMNEVYVTFFPEHLPARSAFGSTGLALGAALEIECLATVGN
ncbi:MAG: RidA family protein [Vicinamibacterales bacterium]|jgi:reactive intermediate/imine deaminase|nr:RidA family protein [Vicinamibacterales bacterium]HJO18208.1 RidA family protein [Vicinamibacterales bacterium]|tara:strand:- start:211 stop:672 length:462 start_codon:yes stop_codon:yes gene_type:complete